MFGPVILFSHAIRHARAPIPSPAPSLIARVAATAFLVKVGCNYRVAHNCPELASCSRISANSAAPRPDTALMNAAGEGAPTIVQTICKVVNCHCAVPIE